MRIREIAGEAPYEITEELYGILSCVEFDANYDYRDDMERLEATYGREAIMDALCCVCPDAEEKLCDQANYFLEQLKTNEYDYFIERMLGAPHENDEW